MAPIVSFLVAKALSVAPGRPASLEPANVWWRWSNNGCAATPR